MKSYIESEDVLFNDFFKVKKAQLRHELYNGEWSSVLSRYSYDKGDAVAALLVDLVREELIIVEQYRYPAGRWMQELVAGALEEGEDPQVGMDREILEETSYKALGFNYLGLFYAAPGVFSERVHLFISTVRPASATELEEISADDDEDICIVRIPFNSIHDYLAYPVEELKTQLAIQHWLLKQKL